MIGDAELFVALAEIAGVFVGFGALISITRGASAEVSDRVQVRGVVLTGLLVVTCALIPVGLERYSLEPDAVWRVSSAAFLLLIWAVILVPLRGPATRSELRTHFQAEPIGSVFLLFLELAVQVPLALVLVGSFPESSPAMYATALIVNLLQAAFQLCQLVLPKLDESA